MGQDGRGDRGLWGDIRTAGGCRVKARWLSELVWTDAAPTCGVSSPVSSCAR